MIELLAAPAPVLWLVVAPGGVVDEGAPGGRVDVVFAGVEVVAGREAGMTLRVEDVVAVDVVGFPDGRLGPIGLVGLEGGVGELGPREGECVAAVWM